MNDLIGGFSICILLIVCYVLSYRCFNRGSPKLGLLLLLIGGLILRVFVSLDFFLHEWDERYHALVAKNLSTHFFIPTLYDNPILDYDYRSWISNHVWLHKPPLPLWIMAISLKLFGFNEIAVRLPSILMSTMGIWLTYKIANRLTDDRIAYLSAFLYSIHGLIIELSGGRMPTDHIDIAFLFFIQLAIFVCLSRKPSRTTASIVGIIIACAILCKSLPALIVLPIMVLWFSMHKMKFGAIVVNILLALCMILLVSLPWQIYTYINFPLEAAWENKFSLMHITEVLEGHSGTSFYHIDKIRIIYGELIYLPLAWFIYKVFTTPHNFRRLILFLWIIIPVIFFSIVKTKMPAYTLFAAPAIFTITAEFYYYLKGLKVSRSLIWLKTIVTLGLVILPIRYSIERSKLLVKRDRTPEWVQEIKDIQKDHAGEKVVVFNSERPIETMFYTDFTAYGHIPDSTVIDSLTSEGYHTLILED